MTWACYQVRIHITGLRRYITQLTTTIDTFIMPTGRNLPSLFTDTKFRLQLEWIRAKRRFQDYLSSIIAYRWQIYRGMAKNIPKPKKPTINMRTIVPVAKKLHVQMYTAYAKGDTKTFQDICTENIRATYLTRIAKRVENREKMSWELVSYKSRPKLCSMKAGGTPLELKGIPIGIQQAVVRIQSLQRLTPGNVMGARAAGSKSTEKEHVVWKEPKEKEVTEYIVVQRRLMEGKYEPWKAWGFVKELDVVAEKKKMGGMVKAQETLLSEGGMSRS
jgi:protein MBA1